MRELATRYEAERRAEEQKLLADLGREPSYIEQLLVENAAGLAVRARRLRRLGRDREADDVARLLIRTIGKLGIKPGRTKPESLEDYLRRTSAEAASAGAVCDESGEAEHGDERTGGFANGEASA